jgi:hypothetical protein
VTGVAGTNVTFWPLRTMRPVNPTFDWVVQPVAQLGTRTAPQAPAGHGQEPVTAAVAVAHPPQHEPHEPVRVSVACSAFTGAHCPMIS